MADHALKSVLTRLRFGLANLAWLPVLALLCTLVAAIVHLAVLPAREAAIDAGERRLASLERELRHSRIAQREGAASPEETRQRLLDRFPTQASLNAELGRLLALAEHHGLQVPTGDYRLLPGKDGLFDRYVLNLPVAGSYRTIRRYVDAVRQEFPELAVEDISLHRENIGGGEVEAQLRFVLFGRQGGA